MRGSTHAGERANAEAAAVRLVQPFGYDLCDVPDLLQAFEKQNTEPSPKQPEPHSRGRSSQADAWAAHERQRQQARTKAEAEERAEVLTRYGGLQAVLAWTEREQRLRAAVAPWSVFELSQCQGRTKSIDGFNDFTISLSNMPPRIRRALSNAYPLPTTITMAAAEHASWQRRERDLGLALGNTSDFQLDLPLFLRQQIVAALVETELRAASIGEVLIRQRHMIDGELMMPEVDQAVLQDLEHLAAEEARASVHNGHGNFAADLPVPTARQRRAKVIALLSNLDAAQLSDREIARRVGVSPQTVGNIRRQMPAR